jgi:hypothetical protein
VCGNPTISGEQLDDYVWRSVSALLKDPARMLEEWSRRQKSGGVTAELQQHRDDAARAVAAFERTMKRLVDAYEVGAIEVEDLKQRSDTVRARSERAQRELADAETRLRETVQLRAIVTQLDDFAARVRARLDALSWLEKRTIIRTLVAKIDIDEKGATIVYRLPSAERTPPPSRANPPSEGTSDQDNRTRCLLRKQRGGLVTAKGLAPPLDARIALALPTRSSRRTERFDHLTQKRTIEARPHDDACRAYRDDQRVLARRHRRLRDDLNHTNAWHPLRDDATLRGRRASKLARPVRQRRGFELLTLRELPRRPPARPPRPYPLRPLRLRLRHAARD